MRRARLRWFRPILAAALLLAALVLAAPAQAARYLVDQRYGSIEFSLSALGLFDVGGHFARFAGELQLDDAHPEHSHIDVTIDARGAEMPAADQTELLRSPAYFDVAGFPDARFVSTGIEQVSPAHYIVHGVLRIRGIEQKQDLDAVLEGPVIPDPNGIPVADFTVSGQLLRSAFGMVADQAMLSDIVHLRIRLRLTLDQTPHAG